MSINAPHRPLFALLALLMLCACGAGTQATQANVAAPSPQPRAPAPVAAPAAQQAFAAWLADFKREALAKGISQPVLDNAFANISGPAQKVLDHDHTQPEKTKTFKEYAKGFLKENRVDAAREQWETHKDILSQVQEAYGVPAPILLALWQTESNFGEVQGNYSVIESLSTLAYDGRRSAFFRTQLLDALIILQQEHMSADALTGSWAGAMGQVQFMPSSYLSFAVDFDGDGAKDIWHSEADALGSMANYLKTRGWDRTLGWGVQVRVSDDSDAASWAESKEWHTYKQWKALGLKGINARKLPVGNYKTRLVMPDNDPDNAYLVTTNYDVIMDWNHSTYFATGVGLLANAIAARE